MSTELREWVNEIWEYCQEHWTMTLAVGAVLLVLLVSFLLVLSAKREDAEVSVLPEAESDMPEAPADEVGTVPSPEPDEAEPADESAQEDVPACEGVQPALTGAQGVMENLLRSVEAASGAAGQKVESIELKIEKAQLTIHYAGTAQNCQGVEEELRQPAAAEQETTAPPEAQKSTETQILPDIAAMDSLPEMAEPDHAAPKKFGTDNMNTARSGRVYTEEELLNQIRD